MGKKILKIFVALLLAISALSAGLFFYFRHQVFNSLGTAEKTKIFSIEKGENSKSIVGRLKKENLISKEIFALYYLKTSGLGNKILPGDYEINGRMKIPEIIKTITQEQNIFSKITFPEGWDSKKMSERLGSNGFSQEGFLEITKNPNLELKSKFSFFSLLPREGSLEGYLFPDTYFFSKKLTSEEIVKKMLNNFDSQLTLELRDEIAKQGKSLEEVVTMASIIEKEVISEKDRKIASGIFWDRIKNGQPLQSCATISYVLGANKKQYTFEDTRIQSPYNTYLNQGLPPGPICNPGISAIRAAIYPTNTDYNYFLSDPETGNTVFSKTIEEHNSNKVKYGL
jgi:UPF0755 protein